MKHPIFIISTGRTGTTFLAEALNELGVRAAHEPGPAWLRLLSNAYVADDMPHEKAVSLLRRARPPEKNWDVEASCLIYGLTRPILEVMPDARVIHLIRDPRTYVRSAMNWGVHRPGGRPLNLIPYRRLTPAQINSRTPRALLNWARSDQFSRVCWTWWAQNEAMRSHGGDEERFITLRMEDLFDESTGYHGFHRILDLAEIPKPSPSQLKALLTKKINEAPTQQFPPWQEWTISQLEELRNSCGELAGQYGYRVEEDIQTLLQRHSDSR